MERNNKAFTLVELIVVITILAILGTIGFLSFQNYNTYARDTVRKSDLSMIARGIKIKQVEGGYAPMPENTVEIYASGTLIGYQGEFTSKIGSRYKLNGKFQDPLDEQNYVYSVDKNLNVFTIGGFLESDETAFNPIVGKSYAKEGRTLTTKGDKFGIILKDGEAVNSTTDFSDLTENKLNILDSALTSNYKLYLEDNEILTGTGLVAQNPTASCKRILELGNARRGDKTDGVYTINPTGDNSIDVYCDMTTNGGGWTLVMRDFSNNRISSNQDGIKNPFSASLINLGSFSNLNSKYKIDTSFLGKYNKYLLFKGWNEKEIVNKYVEPGKFNYVIINKSLENFGGNDKDVCNNFVFDNSDCDVSSIDVEYDSRGGNLTLPYYWFSDTIGSTTFRTQWSSYNYLWHDKDRGNGSNEVGTTPTIIKREIYIK